VGRTVLITGAAGGIGAAGARALYARGANVVLTDLDAGALARLAGELDAVDAPAHHGPASAQRTPRDPAVASTGSRALALALDVTDPRACEEAVAQTVERFGGLDVVWANAGIAIDPPARIANVAPARFEQVIQVNLLGVWRTVRAALPQVIERRGHVLVTSSCYAFLNGMANAPYAMAKAGVEQFGRALRAELAPHGATAGVLYPGWVATPIIGAAFDTGTAAGQLVQRAFPAALRRPVTPERVAGAVVRGIEHRAPSIVCPRRWTAIAALRGLVNPIIDRRLESDAEIRALLAQVG
jgi:NAD(P)-dependent dehydrogenase (short-subunit alcohol dehydrogenase family)